MEQDKMTPGCFEKLTTSLFLIIVLNSSPVTLQSQVVTNEVAQAVKHKPRPLTEWEANQVRSYGLDPTGLLIEADLPVIRQLTPEEMQAVKKQGLDSAAYEGKAVTLVTDQERAALDELIRSAQKKKEKPTPPDLKNAYIWMDSFMGMTNTSIMADVISTKPESVKFQLAGKVYDYSGNYTIMLDKPREHKAARFGFGSPPVASLVMLENFGGEQACLTNATIWEQRKGFIDLGALGKEWIYSGPYTIQK